MRDAATAIDGGEREGGAGAPGPPATIADARVDEHPDAGASPATDAGNDPAVDAGPAPFLPCDGDGVRLCTLEFLPPLPFPMTLDRLAPLDISADGSTIVGTTWDSLFEAELVGAEYHAWIWTLKTRTTMLPDDPDSRPGDRAQAIAASADGAAILWRRARSTAALWRGPENTVQLPFSSVTDMSDDGTVVVGNDRTHAFRWTAPEGMQLLGDLPAPACDLICWETSMPFAVSGDGLVVVGESSLKPFRWSPSTGMQAIPLQRFESMMGSATAANRDGTVIAGCTSRNLEDPPNALWRYTEAQGAIDLGSLSGDGETRCEVALDADGSVVVGSSHGRAFLWDAAHGMRELAVVLAEAGIDVEGWVFEDASGISADGKVITGTATFMGRPVGFVARLP